MALSWFDNKHKYSTVLILLLFFLIGTFVVTGYLTSDEIQEGFNCPNNSILFLSDETGEWGCANLLDQEVNITVNNVTYIYTNYSLFANYSDYCGVLIDGDDTYVPYTGATGDIDINGYKLYAGELQANSTLFGRARIDGLLEIYSGSIYVEGGWINTTGYMSARDFCINGTECIADSLSYWSESEGSLTALYDLYLTKQVSVNANIIGWENITTKGKFCINTTNPQCIDNWQDLNQSSFTYSDYFDQELNTTSEPDFAHADITDLNVGPKGSSYALVVDGRGTNGAPMYIYSSDAGNTIVTSGSSVISTGGSSNFRSGGSQTFQIKDTASIWSYIGFGTWDTTVYSASYPFMIYPFYNHTRIGKFNSILTNTMVFNNSEGVRHYNDVKIYDGFDLEVTGNLTVGGNIVVDGCIQYNCSGGGCITLGDCL